MEEDAVNALRLVRMEYVSEKTSISRVGICGIAPQWAAVGGSTASVFDGPTVPAVVSLHMPGIGFAIGC